MTAFDHFAPQAVAFLSNLKANNTRDWFAANKATYEKYLKEPGKQFADAMALALSDLTGQEHGAKIFRIHRDVRFSKDKTPYNAHLHMAFAPKGAKGQPPAWFFGLSPDGVSLGCGVMQYDKAGLMAFRSAMAGPEGTALIELSNKLRRVGVRISEPELKRVPAGLDKDHPHEEALRRKGFVAWIDHRDPAFAHAPSLVARIGADFETLMPVFQLLSTPD